MGFSHSGIGKWLPSGGKMGPMGLPWSPRMGALWVPMGPWLVPWGPHGTMGSVPWLEILLVGAVSILFCFKG